MLWGNFFKKFGKILKKSVDNTGLGCYNNMAVKNYDPLAQLAEHLTFNQGVRSSNLRWVTIKKALHTKCFFILFGNYIITFSE